jgi:hypothetical protein
MDRNRSVDALIRRTAPCPCGSGRRFKHCHGSGEVPLRGSAALALLESAAALEPTDERLWWAMLESIARGEVRDDEIGIRELPAAARNLRVAVITPYYKEDLGELQRCHASVQGQTIAARHIMVADGFPREEVDAWDVVHLKLERGHADFGDTPRARGGALAAQAGFDAIAYLDADNALRPRHLESLVVTHFATAAAVCYSGRTLELPDGLQVPTRLPDDAQGHIDTSCLFLARPAFELLGFWERYPRHLSVLGDRVFVSALRARGFVPACSGALTTRYTIRDPAVYAAMGVPVTAGARAPIEFSPLFRWYGSLGDEARAGLDALLGFAVRGLLRELNAHVAADLRV